MKKPILFAVLACLLASLACTTFGGTGSSGKPTPLVGNPSPSAGSSLPSVFDAPANPITVSFILDPGRAASADIDVSGGTLTTKSTDGSQFTLDIPAGALSAKTTITMTPIQSMGGLPLSGGFSAAVKLEPSGLSFNKFVSLTIKTLHDIPIAKQIFFGFEKNGEDFHLSIIDPKSKEMKILTLGFSGEGVGQGTTEDQATILSHQASDMNIRLTQAISELLMRERMSQVLGGSDADAAKTMDQFLSLENDYHEKVVKPRMEAAQSDCKSASEAVQTLLTFQRQMELLSQPGAADYQQQIQDLKAKCPAKSFSISGKSNGITFSGQICDIEKPFDANGVGGGASYVTKFTPSSATSGTTVYSGTGDGCVVSGSGTYTVTINGDGSGSINMTSKGTVNCPGLSKTTTNSHTLTIQPLTGLSCP